MDGGQRERGREVIARDIRHVFVPLRNMPATALGVGGPCACFPGSKKPIDRSICGAAVWYSAEVMELTVDFLVELGKVGKPFDEVNSRSE